MGRGKHHQGSLGSVTIRDPSVAQNQTTHVRDAQLDPVEGGFAWLVAAGDGVVVNKDEDAVADDVEEEEKSDEMNLLNPVCGDSMPVSASTS